MTEASDAISGLMEEISTLKKGIGELDYAVAEATEQRKEEHAEYIEMVQMNEAAIGLVGKAKKKLEKFYKPAAASASLVQTQNAQPFSFAQVHAHTQIKAQSEEDSLFDVAPPPP